VQPIDKQSGFTLIELLIVTILLSLLMFSGTYAYSLFTNKWQSELGHFNQSNLQATGFVHLQKILANISPYVIRTDNNQPAFFFVGGPDSLLAITHDGLFTDNSAEAFRLSSVKAADGTYQLLYQARSLANMAIINESQSVEFSDEIVLVDRLDKIQFRYFGWSSYGDKKSQSADNLVGEIKWYDVFSGIDKQLTPEKIVLKLTQGDKHIPISVNLDHDADRWLSSYFDETQSE
jgi:prepilin-type N-terminal cleavage/methylation domain-containing protein